MSKLLRTLVQLFGLGILVPAVALGALRYKHRDGDGPSILFPGGELVSGEIYTGPEPDWSFTRNVSTVELELEESGTSRLIWILESEGKIFIASGYMSTFLGRLWKHWAVLADRGNGEAMVRIDGMRYPRQLIRITEGPVLDGVAAAMGTKYNSPTTRESIEEGNTWIFELAPREE